MAELPLGWITDLAVLDAAGARITRYPDYLLVSSPDNPGYHWGNFILVTEHRAVDESARWLATFDRRFPRAEHRAIGLPCAPDARAWVGSGLELESDEAMLCQTMRAMRPLPEGYTVRRLSDAKDWEQTVTADVLEHIRNGDAEGAEYERFAVRRMRSNVVIVNRGLGAFFGAFSAERLVANLGIVKCGPWARYQSVGTDSYHRRRGLAGHLLGVAADWAREQGVTQSVIVVDPDSPASRLYRSVGFIPVDRSYQAYRACAKQSVS